MKELTASKPTSKGIMNEHVLITISGGIISLSFEL